VLTEHIDDLHKLSQILIERETIDKDQFERLLAGASEEEVFLARPTTQPVPHERSARERQHYPRSGARPAPVFAQQVHSRGTAR
jgi:cell division protease FtsH